MKIDFVWDPNQLVGQTVPRPKGTLSGHAAGLPFEEVVHRQLSSTFGGRVFRHYEVLNEVLIRNPDATSADRRRELFGAPALQYLICRGHQAMAGWRPDSLFVEKQNDTAESILFTDSSMRFDQEITFLDVKTHNEHKKGQPPNIISANKLAEAFELCLRNDDFNFDFTYIGVGWEVLETHLRCTRSQVVSLFKMDPRLYINWAAATQVQFHPLEADQSFAGGRRDWAIEFLVGFCESLQKRVDKESGKIERYRTLIDGVT